MRTDSQGSGRRTFLKAFVHSVAVVLGGSLAGLLGAFALPKASRPRQHWIRAARLEDMTPRVPYPAVVSVPREQGWYRERAQDVVFLVWDGTGEVRALSAVCTHLGCRVRWDADTKRLLCPCHGGAYDTQGAVVAGPPPEPLAPIEAKIQGADGLVMVRL